MKKSLSLLLAALMTASAFTACSENGTDTDDTSASGTVDPGVVEEEKEEDPRFLDDLPEKMDFQGAEIRFVLEEGHGGPLTEQSIFVEEDTGDVVVSAVFARNLAVSDRLNTVINAPQVFAAAGEAAKLVTQSVTANSDDYDVVGVYQYYGAYLGTTGALFNLNSDRFPHFDFTREYWGTGYMDNLSYKGNTPWCTGDLALRYIGGIYATYVNKTLFNANYSDLNIYDIVDNGQWTLDKMYDLTSGVYIDVNGDGKKNVDDIFGYVQSFEDPIDGLAAASLVHFSEIDEDGTPYVALNCEHTINFYEKLNRLCMENDGFFKMTDWSAGLKQFAEGRAMMHVSHILESGLYFREMEDDFAIVPTPKFDEAQPYYNTMIHDGVTLFGIPMTCSKGEAVSALLEALAAESYHSVTPAYYDVALKTKYTRDSDAGRMMDIIREHVSSDFMGLYSNKCMDIIHFFRGALGASTSAISSRMEKYAKGWNKYLATLLEELEENAEIQ